MKPEELKYTKTHEWVAVDGDIATIGITDFAVHLLSDLVYAELPIVGKRLIQGQPFGEVESVKAVSDLYAPMSGVVTDRNAILSDHLDLLTQDPFGAGWMIKVCLADAKELANLLDYQAYKAHCDSNSH